jgi:serine/threonine protein phosphatase PrpC
MAVVVERPQHSLVAVVDGLGHGHDAAVAARIAVGSVEQAKGDVVSIALQCHERMRRSRGAVMSLASFDGNGTMTWLGIGNVRGRLLRRSSDTKAPQALPLLSGTVGDRLPSLRAFTFEVDAGDLLVITTDGVRDNHDARGLYAGSAQQIADRWLHHSAGTSDDALVFVGHYLGARGFGASTVRTES